uniref:Pentraxin family member n=1 Tax=Ailuropoda melanoleuca TaxID=9646 RepID=A0A7N5JIZ8_AILME
MDRLCLFLLVLVNLVGVLAQQDLAGKVFVFAEASNMSHVVIKAALKKPLTSFTVCERVYTELTRSFTTFSYATKASDNDIIIHKLNPTKYSLWLGRSHVTFDVPASQLKWEHVCVAWESATGLAELWLNGVPLPRKGILRGYVVSHDASIVLGQDQDVMGGGFDIKDSFVGELKDVYMFDRVLSPEEIALLMNNCFLHNAVINWRDFKYEIKGYVILKPYLPSAEVCGRPCF